MDKNFEATKKINQITELTVKKYPGAYIKVQQQADSNYCAISTFVPENMRDKGVGKQLYKELIKWMREIKGHFIATCPFISSIADHDKSVQDIYTDIGN